MCTLFSAATYALYIFYIAKVMLYIISWAKASLRITFEKAGYRFIINNDSSPEEGILGLLSPLEFKPFARKTTQFVKTVDPIVFTISAMFKLLQKIAYTTDGLSPSSNGEAGMGVVAELRSEHKNTSRKVTNLGTDTPLGYIFACFSI
ncbi:hypothetical protein BDN72DRAFT_331218 [Pluteus cervinus]|uniref:Uncharacterized protein n=1 Tax=Pluteus cervinus TaxID=181527 RepID=A0ACD3AC45_9AGAR|nr:hypothetical protein BDN72DRAFT_331218 [Pluteus cervinus]